MSTCRFWFYTSWHLTILLWIISNSRARSVSGATLAIVEYFSSTLLFTRSLLCIGWAFVSSTCCFFSVYTLSVLFTLSSICKTCSVLLPSLTVSSSLLFCECILSNLNRSSLYTSVFLLLTFVLSTSAFNNSGGGGGSEGVLIEPALSPTTLDLVFVTL